MQVGSLASPIHSQQPHTAAGIDSCLAGESPQWPGEQGSILANGVGLESDTLRPLTTVQLSASSSTSLNPSRENNIDVYHFIGKALSLDLDTQNVLIKGYVTVKRMRVEMLRGLEGGGGSNIPWSLGDIGKGRQGE